MKILRFIFVLIICSGGNVYARRESCGTMQEIDLNNDGLKEVIITYSHIDELRFNTAEEFEKDERIKFLRKAKGQRLLDYTKILGHKGDLRLGGLEIFENNKSCFFLDGKGEGLKEYEITDLDKDGINEIYIVWEGAASAADTTIFIIKWVGSKYKVVFKYENNKIANTLLADLDGDGKKELIIEEFLALRAPNVEPVYSKIFVFKFSEGKAKLWKKFFDPDPEILSFDINEFVRIYKKEKKYKYSSRDYIEMLKKLEPMSISEIDYRKGILWADYEEPNEKILMAISALAFLRDKSAVKEVERIYKIAERKNCLREVEDVIEEYFDKTGISKKIQTRSR